MSRLTPQAPRQGLPEVFALILDLAEQHGRIPAGQWEHVPAPGWRIKVNGTGEPWGGIPPYAAVIERHGLPFMLCDPAGGTVIGGAAEEDAIIAMLQAAVEQVRAPRADGGERS